MSAAAGRVAPGFEPVRRQFEANLAAGERGAAFAAVRDGEVVADLWGGTADAAAGRAWKEDTLCAMFSGGKGLVAVCMLRLIERGLVDLDAPVARYWPEFAARGKEAVLVRHAVSHQAGLPGIRRPVSATEVLDFELMARRLAEQELFWEPGSRTWYHPLTYGWLCGEIVRRVSGKPLGRYLREEIAAPLDLDLWIGLPAGEQARVARSELAPTWPGTAANVVAAEISAAEVEAIWRNPDFFAPRLAANEPAWRAAEIPGANAIGSARSMAALYGALASGGRIDGRELLGAEAIALGATPLAEGVDPCAGEFLRFGVGWALQTPDRVYGPPERAFGHGGAGGSVSGAWPDERVGFSYLPSALREDADDRRAASLLAALHGCVAGAH